MAESPTELADVFEVLDAVCENRGFKKEEIEQLQNQKREDRGGFKARIILEES